MKSILLIFLIALSGIMAHAQNLYLIPQAYIGNFTLRTNGYPDTTVNADTSYLTVSSSALIGQYNVFIQGAVNNISGTTGGTVTCQGSNDFVTWYACSTSSVEPSGLTSSYTISSLTSAAVSSFGFYFPDHTFTYYRVRFISSGTQTSSVTGILWYRKRNSHLY